MDKKNLLQIGEVARLFHISVGTLRHYEKIGLLYPEYVDKQSGYRYYSTRQFERLNTVRYLRELDTSLEKISEFFDNKSLDGIKRVLESQRLEIAKKRHELEIAEKKINNRLSQLEDALNSEFDTVKAVTVPPRKIAVIKKPLLVKNHLDLELPIRHLEENQNNAVAFLGKVGLSISAEHLKSGEYSVYDRVLLILDGEDSYNGAVTELPECLSAVIRYCGSHSEAPAQYGKLINYINENGLEIAGFSVEVTMIDYAYTSDTDKFVTEIQIPVIPKHGRTAEY